VQGAYYGALLVQELIGPNLGTKVVELPSNSNYTAAYGVYENDKLARAVLLNSQVYVGQGDRQNITVQFRGVAENSSFKVKRFHTPTTNATEGW